MPQLTIRGIQPRLVQEASTELIQKLAHLLQCPEDYMTIDCVGTQSFYKGEQVLTSPFIQIGWFNRGQVVQDAMALKVTEIFKKHGVEDLEIGIIQFDKSSYYSDGVRY